MKKQIKKYAKLILDLGLSIQNGDKLAISCPIELREFAYIIVQQAYELGANKVIVDWNDPNLTNLKYQYEPLENFKDIPSYVIEKSELQVDENWLLLSISGLSSKELKNLDKEKLTYWQKTTHNKLKKKDDAIMTDNISWCIAAAPTRMWAEEIFGEIENATDLLWEKILYVTRCNYDNPTMEWKNHIEKLQKYAQWLNDLQLESLHFTNNLGTNLIVPLVKNYNFLAAKSINQKTNREFIANIPTEEVFTMPNALAVEGIVYNSKPLNYNGTIIDDFFLEFKNGEVINYKAKIGNDALEQLLNVDQGAKRLGEVALVSYNTPISLLNILFYNTLFDENASCHLALGKAYLTTLTDFEKYSKEELKQLGYNESAIHVDFMFGTEDLNIIGKTYDGKEIEIFKNGNFVEL